MTRTLNRPFILFAIFCSAGMQQTANAEQTSAPVFNTGPFVIQLPAVDHAALIEQVTTLRSQLIERKQVLAQTVEDKKLDSGDAIITAIMPGGLLYAGYKKARYEQARNELAQVNADIESLSGDLLAVASRTVPTVVAQVR